MFGKIFPVNDLILDKQNRKQLELLIFFHFSYLKKKYKLAALKVAQAEALLEMLVMRRETVRGNLLSIFILLFQFFPKYQYQNAYISLLHLAQYNILLILLLFFL